MRLSDQEQVILKAIGHGVASISAVVKAVGYPKATTKKVLLRLSEKGIVSLHRHDWPASLTPAQRKLMVRVGSNYYNAVSARERNPIRFEIGRRLSKAEKDEVLKSLGDSYKDFHAPKVFKGFDRDGDPRYGYEYNPEYMYRSDITGRLIRHYIKLPDGRLAHPTELYPNVTKAEIDKYAMEREAAESSRRSRDRSRADRIATPGEEKAGETLKAVANDKYKRTGRKIEGSYFAQDGAGRVVRVDAKDPDDAPYYEAQGFKQITSVVNMSKAKRNPKAGKGKTALKKTGRALKGFAQGALSAGSQILGAGAMALNPSRKRKTAKKAKKKASKRNASRTTRAVSKAKRSVASRKASRTAKKTKVRSVAKTRKAATRRVAVKKGSRAVKGKRNPSAESIRREFAGSINGERDLFFPQGTPTGKLAKLGKLVSITTEEGTIKPVSGSAWLCADTKGKLHIGSVSGAPLFDGPARSFGHVTKLEYESSKPHLGYGPTIWFHRVGEENHIRPTLRADGKGGLVFKGGDYRLTRRGLEN